MTERQACEGSGRLALPVVKLAASLLRAHAMILYDFLARPYESQLAQARATSPKPGSRS